MPPKTSVGAEEDVKFLLTVIKQLGGTVSPKQAMLVCNC